MDRNVLPPGSTKCAAKHNIHFGAVRHMPSALKKKEKLKGKKLVKNIFVPSNKENPNFVQCLNALFLFVPKCVVSQSPRSMLCSFKTRDEQESKTAHCTTVATVSLQTQATMKSDTQVEKIDHKLF